MSTSRGRFRGRKYARFNEREDVLSSLDLAALSAERLKDEPSYWKWLILAAHSALQGAAVCVLSGTHGTGALTPKSQAEMLRYLEEKGPYPQERLADFKTLIKWARDSRRASYLGSEPVQLNTQEERDLRRLNDDLRNNFSHFTPKGWSIELAGLPRIILTAVRATEHLINQPPVLLHLSGNQKRRAARKIATIRSVLEAYKSA